MPSETFPNPEFLVFFQDEIIDVRNFSFFKKVLGLIIPNTL